MLHKTTDYAKLLMILAFLLLTGCAGSTGTPDGPIATVEEDDSTMAPIEDIAAEFKSLRKVKGHFGGGTWNDNVDKWICTSSPCKQ